MSCASTKREAGHEYDARVMAATRSVFACRLTTLWALGALAPLPACAKPAAMPPRADSTPARIIDDATRIRVARAEAARGGGLDELVELATHGERPIRLLALRGLGRVGGTRARTTLEAAIADVDPVVATAAAGAYGVLVTLDPSAPPFGDDLDAGAHDAMGLVAVSGRVGTNAAVVLEAIGRTGGLMAAAPLVAAIERAAGVAVVDIDVDVDGPGAAAEEAALAIGRWGRRKQIIDGTLRAVLARATAYPARAMRDAATYALAREHGVTTTEPAVTAALIARLRDDSVIVRATAAAALGRRKLAGAAASALVAALADPDWHVGVEAVRALGGEDGTDAARYAIAEQLATRLARVVAAPAQAHVVLEALRTLAAHGARPEIAKELVAFQAALHGEPALPAITRGWFDCLATAALVRGLGVAGDLEPLATCGSSGLPDHLRLPLAAEAIVQGTGTLEARRAWSQRLLGHADPRVRAAGLATLVPLARLGARGDRAAAVATLVGALASPVAMVAGSAGEAVRAIFTDPSFATAVPAVQAALIARANREPDVELAAALLALIGQHAIVAGEPTCRASFGRHAVLDRAAAECLRALGGKPPAFEPLTVAPPPVDLAAVVGKRLEWRLATSRGELRIDLRPDIAPWAVATIVALTRKGFYDGREVHRVVGNFVAQSGDPLDSGWGGPGFLLPPEPATRWDSNDGYLPGFDVGGVGMADAGPGSGGSQWFVMHARAPHLDGRYTWFGRLQPAGQGVAEALLVGDTITAATIVER